VNILRIKIPLYHYNFLTAAGCTKRGFYTHQNLDRKKAIKVLSKGIYLYCIANKTKNIAFGSKESSKSWEKAAKSC
jgi:hypothetical protein